MRKRRTFFCNAVFLKNWFTANDTHRGGFFWLTMLLGKAATATGVGPCDRRHLPGWDGPPCAQPINPSSQKAGRVFSLVK